MPYSTLDEEGNKTFEKIYNNALTEYKGDKEKAARTAWVGIKNAGYSKGDDGQWVKKSSPVVEMSMTVVKASYETKEPDPNKTMRWRATASDTDKDLYGESMSGHLFEDFVERIENNTPVPEAFKSAICEEGWCGGLPYVSISHYRGAGGKNVPGIIDGAYIDGNTFKSKGFMSDTPLGRAAFESLRQDLIQRAKGIEVQDPVRVSIGFVDLAHKHLSQNSDQKYLFERKNLIDSCPMCEQGVGGKVYWSGILVHEALTRVPVNPRTEAEVDKSMGIITKKDDARSIVGDLADTLEEKSIMEKALVIKADGQTIAYDNSSLFNTCYDPNTNLYNQECIDRIMMGHMTPMRNAMQANEPEHKPVSSSSFSEFSTTKKESDGEHNASHYLVVEDSAKPSTWHLRVKDSGGKIDSRLLGAAHAALTVGYRGNQYEGPDKGKALAKLKNLYHSAGLAWPDELEEKSMAKTKVPYVEDEVDSFADDERIPDVPDKETNVNPASAPKKYVGKAKAYEGKETPDEEDAEEKDETTKQKAMRKSYNKLEDKVAEVKKKGMTGEEALRTLQPLMNDFASSIQRSVTGGQTDANAELVSVVRALQESVSVLTQELAVTKAQLSQGSTVTRSAIPQPRSLQLNFSNTSNLPIPPMQEKSQAPFSDIKALARQTVGL